MIKKIDKKEILNKKVIAITVVALVSMFLLSRIPSFLKPQNLSNLILRGVPLLALAIGQMLVLLTGSIDLSVGALLSVSTAIASVTMQHSVGLGILASCGFAIVLGLGNGLAVTKLKINPFLVTLGTTAIINGIALYIRPYPGGIIPLYYSEFILLKVGVIPVVPIILFLIIAILGIFLLRKTLYGRHLYAVGGNSEAARLAGLNVDRIIIIAYMLSGLFAAIGGLYMSARIGCGDPTVGKPFQMESITAAVLGGTALTGGKGKMRGTILGVILVILLGNIFNLLNFNIYWQQVSRGIILLIVVAISSYEVSLKDTKKLKRLII
ncbi:MAG: ABC transporter permease [Bacteroidia bacterium]|nr:ABC transporter permease [Bacteroidia bacterium]